MSLTTDRNDPELHITEDSGMQRKYLILSEEERNKGFVRAIQQDYIHDTCGGETHMGLALSETYARDPKFYGATFCVHCGNHFPVGEDGEFTWTKSRMKVGT